jgi:hypothetical protein
MLVLEEIASHQVYLLGMVIVSHHVGFWKMLVHTMMILKQIASHHVDFRRDCFTLR